MRPDALAFFYYLAFFYVYPIQFNFILTSKSQKKLAFVKLLIKSF